MNKLQSKGFNRYQLADILSYEGLQRDLAELTKCFENLPEDPYAKGLNRFRRYSRAVILPIQDSIEWLPSIEVNGERYSEYFQGRFNPEHVDSYRKFSSLTMAAQENELLKKIILFDFHQTFWRKEDILLPVHVGVHFVKLLVKNNNEKAVSSPNNLHQDGEPFTFAHLIKRENVIGGINAIATPKNAGKLPSEIDKQELHATFEISNPLDSYGVYDPMVSHYVSPVEKGIEDKPGVRSVILIDFQPTVVADVDENKNIPDIKQMVMV
ncbi:2OG-Fe dioxygenase family protein [Bacillus songklensis]|uniref:2OG-Fe dioxygenase family protein n=1 Tax=Bacillus songklensis TaxID=1069116 RepID=A0ABV8AWP9_9BACI